VESAPTEQQRQDAPLVPYRKYCRRLRKSICRIFKELGGRMARERIASSFWDFGAKEGSSEG